MNGPLVIGDATLWLGDCLEVLPRLDAGSFDAVVTDPPYALTAAAASEEIGHPSWNGSTQASRSAKRAGFMGLAWDGAHPPAEVWAEALRLTAPGGFLLAFGGTRTFHRLACAVEDAGWEITDTLMWLYGSGFPKGRSCLKPAWEPVILARRPAPRVRPLNVDECRVPTDARPFRDATANVIRGDGRFGTMAGSRAAGETDLGRWPANVVHDGSDEVLEAFAAFGESKTTPSAGSGPSPTNTIGLGINNGFRSGTLLNDAGTAARFFYTAKASAEERAGGKHPTMKPLDLMRWLVRLVVPKGGVCLDPFAGSMTTVMAALREGRRCVAVEREAAYFEQGAERVRGFYGEAKGDLFAAAR